MFQVNTYLATLIELLKAAFGERLLYVGLQGSYLRDEATEHSDIDIMTVIKEISVDDLDAYRTAIESLENPEQSCGFIFGADELQVWNPLELCHLAHTTKDYYGKLTDLIPTYTNADVRNFVKMSLGNLYHELCHRYIHAPREKNIAKLPFTYKSVFFILQNLHYLESRHFINSKQALLKELTGKDHAVLEAALSMEGDYDFDKHFELLFTWCKETMERVSSEF